MAAVEPSMDNEREQTADSSDAVYKFRVPRKVRLTVRGDAVISHPSEKNMFRKIKCG
jgi:hypothetical protein